MSQQVDHGAYSLYGFVYQIYLSLVTILHGSVDGLRVVRTNLPAGTAETLLSGDAGKSRLTTDVLVALEGCSDVDIHRQGRVIEYVQVKSHPQSRKGWTINNLFKEVIQKLPFQPVLQGDSLPRFTLVTDTGLNPAVKGFVAICQWLAQKPNDIEWVDWLTREDAKEACEEVSFPSSKLWGNRQLKCQGRDLPRKLLEYGALFSSLQYGNERNAEGANQISAAIAGSEETNFDATRPSLTIEQVCQFLTSFRIVTNISFDSLQDQVCQHLRRYVPVERIPATEARLVRFALTIASEQPGRLISRREFLAKIGIHQAPYHFDDIRDACERVLNDRLLFFPEDVRIAARRSAAEESFSRFLSLRDLKVYILSGASRIGKSRQIREWARRHSLTTCVYLDEGKRFNGNNAAHEVCRALGHEGQDTHLDFLSLVERARETCLEGRWPFLLFIDALDEADSLGDVKTNLRPILETIRSVPIKVVLSCKTFAWDLVRPILEPVRQWVWQPDLNLGDESQVTHLSPTFTLNSFSAEERDEVLTANGLSTESMDEVLQETLREPGYFSIYCRLSPGTRGTEDGEGGYPVTIYKRYWSEMVGKWSSATHKRLDTLEQCLIRVAECIYAEASADVSVGLDRLRGIQMPVTLDVDNESQQSPYFAAKQLGLLGESRIDPSEEYRVAFQPPYLLEFALMRAIEEKLPSDQHDTEALSEWLRQIYEVVWQHRFDPVVYSLAFLVQAICLKGDSRGPALLSQVLNGWIVRPEFFVRIVSDACAPALTQLIRDGDPFQARRALAALGTRRSVEAILQLTEDPEPKVRHQGLLALEESPVLEDRIFSRLLAHQDESDWTTNHTCTEAMKAFVVADLDNGSQALLRIAEQGLMDNRPYVRRRCAEAVADVAHRSSIPALRAALPEDCAADPELFHAVTWGLACLGDQEYVLRPLLTVTRQHSGADWAAKTRAIGSLNEFASPAAREAFVSIIEEGPQGSDAVAWAFQGLRRIGDTGTAVSLLRPVVLADREPKAFAALWELGRIEAPEATHVLLECLVRAGETSPAADQWTLSVAETLAAGATADQIQVLTHLHQRDEDLWKRVEAIAFRLAVEIGASSDPDTTNVHGTRAVGRHLLTQIGSPRLTEAFAISLSASASNAGLFPLETVLEELITLGTEDDLVALQAIEQTHRGVRRPPPDSPLDWRLIIIDKVAQAVASIGTDTAYELYLNLLCFHDLSMDGLNAITYFSSGVLNLQKPVDAIGDRSLGEVARTNAVYASMRTGRISSEDLARILEIFCSTELPVGIRHWAAKALGCYKFHAANPALKDEFQKGLDESPLQAVCEEALCRLGDTEIGKRLMELVRASALDSVDDFSGLVWRLTQFDERHPFRPQVDNLLIDIIGLDSGEPLNLSHCRCEAMLGIQRSRNVGNRVPGASEALCRWLGRPHHPSMTMTDDFVGPGVLAELNPIALCETTRELSLENWSIGAQESLIKAFGQTELPQAAGILDRWIQSGNARLRRAAAHSLSLIKEAEAITERRLTILAEQGPNDARSAAEALLWQEGEWVPSLLERLLHHDDRRVRLTARTVTRWRRDQSEANRLIDLLMEDPSATSRQTYAQVLSRRGNEGTLKRLEQFLTARDSRYGIQHRLLAVDCHTAIKKRMEEFSKNLDRKPIWEI